MLGAIIGDIIGSVYERRRTKRKDFPLFTAHSRYTDDTVLTVAVAQALLTGDDLADTFHQYVDRFPRAGYGGNFKRWAKQRKREPYNSWGNGSAMRASPVAYAGDTLDEVLQQAQWSAEVTHNHPEGIKGAQATAVAVFLARQGADKAQIKSTIEDRFGYDLSNSLDAIREVYYFDVSCQGSVPESLIAFLEADDFEDAVRNAVSLGGDADTMACIAGAVAEPFFGIPAEIRQQALERLDPSLLEVTEQFRARFGVEDHGRGNHGD